MNCWCWDTVMRHGLPVRRVCVVSSPLPPPTAWISPPQSQSVLGRGPGRALHRCSESSTGPRARVASQEHRREQKRCERAPRVCADRRRRH
ncbi:hypothetical protein EVAR_69064_1 [Eumeta japonica]|uniref:Uncharacterized protein n=1 Tax=Eumeta variegata TaxID=151549 RepID=A0A4C1ZHF9_EUMVA|nr:hypothetical protein EVAR_69064_1 [Eumeta japonica]